VIYLEEEIATHRKFVLAGSRIRKGGVLAALGLYVAGIGYARKHLTNGRVDDEFLTAFLPNSDAIRIAKVLASKRVGLWHRVRGGYQIHDFLDHNEAAEKLKHKRELARRRKAAERARKDGAATTLPDVTHSVTHDVTRDSRARDPLPLPLPLSLVQKEKNPALRAGYAVTTKKKEGEGEILRWRRVRSRGTDATGHPNVPVLAALARHVLLRHQTEDDGDLVEFVKCAAARANLKYDGHSVGLALDHARRVLAQMARRRSTA